MRRFVHNEIPVVVVGMGDISGAGTKKIVKAINLLREGNQMVVFYMPEGSPKSRALLWEEFGAGVRFAIDNLSLENEQWSYTTCNRVEERSEQADPGGFVFYLTRQVTM